MKKVITLLLCMVVSAVYLVGCKPKTDPRIDPNRTQIYVHVANGGYGYSWLEDAALDFEKEVGNEKYQVIVIPSVDEDYLNISTNIRSGSGEDLYFLSHSSIRPLIGSDLLEDLSDVWEMDVEGTTVGDKLKYPDTVKSAFNSNNGEGNKVYGLPYGDSFVGFVFDFELFKEKGWLFTSGGELTAGPDKKKGTYDDGQPENMAEWNTMINKIVNETADAYPFVYTTKYIDYITTAIDAIMTQYSGMDAYETFLNFSGDYTDADGNTVTVTRNEGYKVYNIPGLEKAVDFIKTNLASNRNYVVPKAWETTEFSHRDAQNQFLLGNKNMNATNPIGAMLFEGIWWENEAKPLFKTLEDRGFTEWGYGKREYRYMLFPAMEGQVGANGDGTGSVFASMDAGAVFVPKNSKKSNIVQKAKEFLAYTCRDKYLKAFTLSSGAVRPYKYSLSDDEIEKLTPFQRNVWSIVNDTENVTIIRPEMQAQASDIAYATSKNTRFYSLIGSDGYGVPMRALMRHSAVDFLNGMRSYNQDNWSLFLSQL